jgi:hypothetical protein
MNAEGKVGEGKNRPALDIAAGITVAVLYFHAALYPAAVRRVNDNARFHGKAVRRKEPFKFVQINIHTAIIVV